MATPGSTGEINLTTKASPKVMERFKQKSVTEGLFSTEYSWDGNATVRIPSIDVVPMYDYNAERVDGGSRFGNLVNLGDTWQEHTIKRKRSFIFAIDETYNTQQMQIKKASRDLKREIDEVTIPEVDKYRIREMAKAATSGHHNLASETLSESNIVKTIFGANAAMSENLIGEGGRLCLISHKTAMLTNLATQLVGSGPVGKGSAGERSIVSGILGQIDGCQIKRVPSGYLPPNVEFMIIKKGICFSPTQLKSYRINPGAHVLEGKIATGLVQYDCFVPVGRENAIFVVTSGASSMAIVGTGVLALADGTLDVSGSGAAYTATLSKSGGAKTVAVSTVDGNGVETADVLAVVSADPAKVKATYDPSTKLITLVGNITTGTCAITIKANGKIGYTTPADVVLTITGDT